MPDGRSLDLIVEHHEIFVFVDDDKGRNSGFDDLITQMRTWTATRTSSITMTTANGRHLATAHSGLTSATTCDAVALEACVLCVSETSCG